MAAVDQIKIALKLEDAGAVNVVKKLESSFRGLANAANKLDSQGISKVRDRIKAFDTAGKRNINTIQSQIGALRSLRAEAQIGSTQFKQLTADIAKYSQELQKAEGRKKSGGRLAGVAKGVGAIAAGGVFGGPEGAIGGGIGLALGGPGGAAVGAAIGAQVGQIRQALGATAEYAATLTKLRIALKGVTEGQGEYQEGLQFIQQTTKDFAVPQEVVTRQFTKLQASVSGAGGNLKDTKTAFNGIIAAVRATGGSLQDVDSALTATAQVFSKGKVSAEELRQQLGERLPGAFTLFAESVGMTPKELDKALEGGKVTLEDFQTFAESLFKKYGETAKTIADSPDAAGDRLKVVLDSLSENVGELLKPIGASFQETFINIVEFIDMATGRLKLFLELGAIGTKKKVDRLSADITRLLKKQEDFNRTDRAAGRSVIRPSDRRMVEHQLEQKREQLQAAQATLRDLTGFNIVVDAPKKKKGLDGGGDLPTTPVKDIDEATATAQIQALRNRERGIVLTKEMIAEEARLARIAAQTLPTQKKRVKLVEIEIREKNQINAVEQKQLRTNNSIAKAKIDLNKLLTKANGESGVFTDEQLKQAEAQIQLNELMLKFNVLVENGVLSADELKAKLQEAVEALNQTAKKGMNLFKDRFKKGIESMGDLFGNLGDAAARAFDGLGDKLHEFITTGKADFKDFARSVLSDLSKIFLKAAMFNILKSMPGMSFLGSAKGNAFTQNGIVPFAKGGLVNSPTIFPYAAGGTGKFGLMGEAGPEAILPLRRGPDGRLGVENTGASRMNAAMSRYSRNGVAPGQMTDADGMPAAGGMGGGSAALDVRYNVERINNVDYVTAAEFEQGMTQAAKRGAELGRRNVYSDLVNKRSIRSRVAL